MILRLLALFTIVPLIELALLIPLGQEIGLPATIALVLGTAILGAVLGKLEGARAWTRIKSDLNSGKMPADSILDGLAVLIAGIFLVTPGVLTDVFAILLLIPPTRAPMKAIAKKRFEKMTAGEGGFGFMAGPGFGASPPNSAQGGPSSPFGADPFKQSRDGDEDIIDVSPHERPTDDDESGSSAPGASQPSESTDDEQQRIHYLE